MENPYQNMLVYDPALFHSLIDAFYTPQSRQQSDSESCSSYTSETNIAANLKSKKLTCSQCNKGFTNSYGYKIHMADHTGQKKHHCPRCPYATNNPSNFKRHQGSTKCCSL